MTTFDRIGGLHTFDDATFAERLFAARVQPVTMSHKWVVGGRFRII